MTKYKISGKGHVINIAERDVHADINIPANTKPEFSKPEKSQEPNYFKDPTTSHLLISMISDIFSSVYQKEIKAGISEANSKTFEFLKTKLHDLNTKGREIHWLDVGCGNGRCLEVLDIVQNHENITYHGIDGAHRYLDEAEERAKKYSLKEAKFEKLDAARMNFSTKYDLVSSVLVLHEINPLCLPFALRNMLRALKDGGTLVISDFQEPYELEKRVVVWNDRDIRYLLENILGAKTSFELKQAEKFPKELGFYCCYARKQEIDEAKFNKFMQGYGDFLERKKEKSKKKREELRSQLEKRVREILNRPDIDTKNISDKEMKQILGKIEEVYMIKAQKIGLLTSQIEFIDDKIHEFKKGNINTNITY